MKGKLIFLAGAATGFVIGSKAGRGAYESLKARATQTLEDPKVKKGLESAGEFVASQAPVVGHKLQDAASTVASKVKKSKDSDDGETSSTASSADASSTDASDGGDAHGPMTPATPAP
ncbi:hypothetical protein CLV49_0743 [Labedella gwakjiensis]|uniref:YtxH domain-containing protein n=1 Tax=Labedella gwakjiensis TaxID=390269 RepID=A0A2P8GT44_9MICO|nr:hypothetical protein [Labedella gwakjiensis]PSL37137.1 hypothetical protein CLV49_0743 [Labedella gwakjiensis]RUQ81961.1 YtxH domain-containing protein [Labedella gwakjiensis]